MLGLLVVAAVLLMAFTGIASATTLTSPANTVFKGKFHAAAGETTIHGVVTVVCHKSAMEGNVTDEGGTGKAVKTFLTSFSLSECTNGNHTIVEEAGTLELKTTTLYSYGAKIRVDITSLGIFCIYTTSGQEIGTVTGGTTAKIHVDSVKIPQTGPNMFCGSSGEWTGSYVIDTPDTLLVDH